MTMAKAHISVIGAGLMGHGIAQVFAVAGHDVSITDTAVSHLNTVKDRIAANLRDLGEDESAVVRVRPCNDLAEAVREADYVVEAVSEDLALKRKLFADIERHVRRDTILASNTSVIPITSIMQGLTIRERALGTHWWNPRSSYRSLKSSRRNGLRPTPWRGPCSFTKRRTKSRRT